MEATRRSRTKCGLCGSAERTRLFEKDGYPVARCTSCGLVQLDVELGRDELEAIYGADYFTEAELLHDYMAERATRLESGRRVAGALARITGGGRLLDVGCAAGFFLQPASSHYDVTGVELSPFAAEYARREFGLRVFTGDVSEIDFDGERFDVVTMWNTIEHVSDPVTTVHSIARIVRPGGLLVLSTGDVTGPLARRDLEGWNLMLPPYHLFFFSPATMELLLGGAGFEVRRVIYDGILADSGRLRSPRAQRVASLLGLGNVMTIYAVARGRPVPPSSWRRVVARFRPLRLTGAGRP